MMDVDAATEWSKQSLNPGGYFVFNEYVGPSRFQWGGEELAIANDLHATIPETLTQTASQRGVKIEPIKQRPTVQRMIKRSPSEAADIINILPALNQHFPEMEFINLGGAIYMMALGDVVSFIKEPDHLSWLQAALCLDKAMSNAGNNYFSAGLWALK